MEVVKVGDVPSAADWSAEVICKKEEPVKGANGTKPGGGCEAVLKVAEGDLVLMSWYGTHCLHHYSAVRCPNCGKYTHVDIPEPMWERLRMTKTAIPDGFDDSI
jgi:hypothetical protein